MADDETTWVDDVRATQSLAELMKLYEELGGANNGPEFTRVFSWRKAELEQQAAAGAQHLGDHFTSLSPAINQVFDDWGKANDEFRENGKRWAAADAKLKRLQGKKFLYYKQAHGGSAAEVESRVNDDGEIFDLRLERNTYEAAMKVSYKVIELLEARWAYLQSLMVTERAADGGRGPQG